MMQVSGLLPDVSVVLPSAGGCRLPDVKHCSSFFEAKCLFSNGFSKKDMDVTSIFSSSTELFDTINNKKKALQHAPLVDCDGIYDKYVLNCSFPNPKLEIGPEKLRTRGFMVRASGNSGGDLIPVAPLQLESPVGQLLAQILQTHPHLLLATAEQQLENLQSQRDGQKETTAPSPQDLLLYKYVFFYYVGVV
ncbi:UNVERIFIED_CONTAM: UV-B-induced protein, chloroplastic [Sesamum latifolium]|uniref:UV-B-induced protein, chloroplastic n=1 Tax=Sesamum latifolium TaxID=2727402 RepID=A0AAW2SQI0_9LAMI